MFLLILFRCIRTESGGLVTCHPAVMSTVVANGHLWSLKFQPELSKSEHSNLGRSGAFQGLSSLVWLVVTAWGSTGLEGAHDYGQFSWRAPKQMARKLGGWNHHRLTALLCVGGPGHH